MELSHPLLPLPSLSCPVLMSVLGFFLAHLPPRPLLDPAGLSRVFALFCLMIRPGNSFILDFDRISRCASLGCCICMGLYGFPLAFLIAALP